MSLLVLCYTYVLCVRASMCVCGACVCTHVAGTYAVMRCAEVRGWCQMCPFPVSVHLIFLCLLLLFLRQGLYAETGARHWGLTVQDATCSFVCLFLT